MTQRLLEIVGENFEVAVGDELLHAGESGGCALGESHGLERTDEILRCERQGFDGRTQNASQSSGEIRV